MQKLVVGCKTVFEINPRGQFLDMVCALHQTACALCPIFEKLFSGVKFQRRVQKMAQGANWFMKSTPGQKNENYSWFYRHRLSRAVDVKEHRWFKSIDWKNVVDKKLSPPIIPTLQHYGDTSNYDDFEVRIFF